MTTIWKDQPFRVLRVIPTTPTSNEDEVVAKLDLIQVEYKLLLFDCELHVVDGVAEAYVKVPDLRVLLRYYLEPEFRGEIDFDELLDQMNAAVCKHFELPADSGRTTSKTLHDFLCGPEWPEWVRVHRTVPSVKEAVVEYAASAAR